MLPSDNGPLLGIFMANLGDGLLHEFQIVDFDTGTVYIGKLFSVCQLSLSPEEFNSVQVWPVRSVPNEWYAIFLEPRFYIAVVMV